MCLTAFFPAFFLVSGARRVTGTGPTAAREAAFTAVTALNGFGFFFLATFFGSFENVRTIMQ